MFDWKQIANLGIILIYKSTFAESSCMKPVLPKYTEQITPVQSSYPDTFNLRYKCEKDHFFPNHIDEHKISCVDGKWIPKNLWKCTDKCKNACSAHGECITQLSSSSICSCDQGWAGPKCTLRACDEPILKSHGTIQTIQMGKFFPNSTKYRVGSVILFGCQPGYKIVTGRSNARCYTSGWSHQDVPQCELSACKAKEFDNGKFRPMLPSYTAGESISFVCHEGYRLSLPNNVFTITCQTDGYWLQFWPKCQEILCSTPKVIEHGLLETTSLDKFKIGSTITFSCNTGYVLVGDTQVQCIEGVNNAGIWRESGFPQCMTVNQFSEHCILHHEQMVKKNGKYVCVNPSDINVVPSRGPIIVVTARPSSAKPLTIVTATAGGLLLLLLVVITFVAFQRRRLARHSRGRRGRHRLSDDDRYAFLYYSNDFHLVLPSYDEAMQGRRPQPPPYASNEANERDNPAAATPSAPASNIGINVVGESAPEEHPYETIAELLLERTRLSNNVEQSTNNEEPVVPTPTNNTETLNYETTSGSGNSSGNQNIAESSVVNDEPIYARVVKSTDITPKGNDITPKDNDTDIENNAKNDTASLQSFTLDDTTLLQSFTLDDTAPLIKSDE